MSAATVIGVDWGTTRRRAWLLDGTGGIIEARGDGHGIARTPGADFAAELAALVDGWPDVPVLMSGMVGSRAGWREAPYVGCPAGIADIAASLLSVAERPATFIAPGLSVIDGERGDVLRGEEAQIFGIAAQLDQPALVILPGTHSKWISLADSRIETFHTFPTGELFAAILDHTVLGSLADSHDVTPSGFERGLRHAAAATGLLASLFQTRAGILLGICPPGDGAGFLSGLLIASEIAEGRALFAGADGCAVIGAEQVSNLYCTALERSGIAATRFGEDIAARGLWAIASEARLI